MNERCSKCLFFDLCLEGDVLGDCEHFSPCDDEDGTDGIDGLIEVERRQFIAQWYSYMSEYGDE